MRREDVDRFARWFASHVASFYRGCSENDRPAYERKDRHTREVVALVRQIGCELSLPENDLLLAETTAWFHDIGRFTQWKQYGTFSDTRSEDHALLGLKIIGEHELLAPMGEEEQNVVRGAIRHHGRRSLPPSLPQRITLFAKLLRDADKLDIWRQLVAFEPGQNAANDNVATYGLPKSSAYSSRIMADLLQRKSSDYHYAETQVDALLLRLGWVFDLNFSASRRLVLEKGYAETLVRGLPNTAEVAKLKAELFSFLREENLCVR